MYKAWPACPPEMLHDVARLVTPLETWTELNVPQTGKWCVRHSERWSRKPWSLIHTHFSSFFYTIWRRKDKHLEVHQHLFCLVFHFSVWCFTFPGGRLYSAVFWKIFPLLFYLSPLFFSPCHAGNGEVSETLRWHDIEEVTRSKNTYLVDLGNSLLSAKLLVIHKAQMRLVSCFILAKISLNNSIS